MRNMEAIQQHQPGRIWNWWGYAGDKQFLTKHGVQVRSRCSKHGDSWATPGRPARSGQSTMPTSQ